MSGADFFIRPTTEDDIPTILSLIYDLATYEKAAHLAQATPELLKRNLFELHHAHALLAFAGTSAEPGEALGLALYYFNFSTWTGKPGLYTEYPIITDGSVKLEDLFVKPEARSTGIGKAFFAELGAIAQEKDCARMEWVVLKWNQPSIDFYEKKLKAKAMTEWMGMRLEESQIDNLKKLSVKPN
ncbi:hypothetical protein HETIRDRAFT_107579 [Heterobasidion irregulare TC 32-1]|uniref:N-acetyltransferase domain-containing protein n=1 Tax=Heterobasidion irregulare (strain TC 32-1) TaxID=747525 RepID=W4JXY0_HETIT|nr:uncharacterized protein HETIRDRAFT_107579 [Heterobasidion irregulare TC 32-1]ETW77950.1 hypothetical protein HETIRDRAFT_107579 [Heterobasidion irregulare TC 32-1]